MAGKIYKIEELMEECAVTIEVNGKQFVVKDLPLDLSKDADGDGGFKRMVIYALGCEEADLNGYGIAKLTKIMDILYENLLPSRSTKNEK